MIVGEAERRVEIKGFLIAGSSFLAPATYVLIVRYAFFYVWQLFHVSYKAMSRGANIVAVGGCNEMIVGEADRRVEIKGFLMAGSSFLAPATYVLIVRYDIFEVRQLLH